MVASVLFVFIAYLVVRLGQGKSMLPVSKLKRKVSKEPVDEPYIVDLRHDIHIQDQRFDSFASEAASTVSLDQIEHTTREVFGNTAEDIDPQAKLYRDVSKESVEQPFIVELGDIGKAVVEEDKNVRRSIPTLQELRTQTLEAQVQRLQQELAEKRASEAMELGIDLKSEGFASIGDSAEVLSVDDQAVTDLGEIEELDLDDVRQADWDLDDIFREEQKKS